MCSCPFSAKRRQNTIRCCLFSQIIHHCKGIHECKLKERKCVLLFVCNASLIINPKELLMLEDEAKFMKLMKLYKKKMGNCEMEDKRKAKEWLKGENKKMGDKLKNLSRCVWNVE